MIMTAQKKKYSREQIMKLYLDEIRLVHPTLQDVQCML